MTTSVIPGIVNVHPRAVWQDPAKPVTGSQRFNPAAITQVVAHYTADDDLIDGDPGENIWQMPAYMRAMQASYLKNRGYSLGYCWAIDWLGGVWEIRGFDYESAANVGDPRKIGKGKNANDWTLPILCLVDGNDAMTPAALASFRALGFEMERRAHRSLSVITHQDLDYTNCAGRGIIGQVARGEADPGLPVTPPRPPSEVTIMLDQYHAFEEPTRPFDTRAYVTPQRPQVWHLALPRAFDPSVNGVTINVKVTQPLRAGNLVAWTGNSADPPGTSNLDFAPGETVNNEITVPLAPDNTFKLALRGAPGDTLPLAHIVIDHLGNWT